MDHRDAFTTETERLPEASNPSVVRLYNGDTFDLSIRPVRKRIGDNEVRMLGYNGSIPGPTLHVDQGSEITRISTAPASRARCQLSGCEGAPSASTTLVYRPQISTTTGSSVSPRSRSTPLSLGISKYVVAPQGSPQTCTTSISVRSS